MVKMVVHSELPWLEMVVSRATMDGSGSAVVTPGSRLVPGTMDPWCSSGRIPENPVKGPFFACPLPLKICPHTDLPKPAGGEVSYIERGLQTCLGSASGSSLTGRELYANKKGRTKVYHGSGALEDIVSWVERSGFTTSGAAASAASIRRSASCSRRLMFAAALRKASDVRRTTRSCSCCSDAIKFEHISSPRPCIGCAWRHTAFSRLCTRTI